MHFYIRLNDELYDIVLVFIILQYNENNKPQTLRFSQANASNQGRQTMSRTLGMEPSEWAPVDRVPLTPRNHAPASNH